MDGNIQIPFSMEHGDLNRDEKSKCRASPQNVIGLLRLENDYILERLKFLFKSN